MRRSMGDAAPPSMTVEDYFRLEETSPIRHEYVAGEVYAMSGATARHNRIAGNIFARLLPLARAGPCDAFMNDVRLEAASHRYCYPDVMVVCTGWRPGRGRSGSVRGRGGDVAEHCTNRS